MSFPIPAFVRYCRSFHKYTGANEKMTDKQGVEQLLIAAEQLAGAVDGFQFSEPVTHVYNPLRYAWEPYARYVELYARPPKKVLFLGMNPGPWGMAQTGVPFGEIDHVRHWLNIENDVFKPPVEHPKRPIEGFGCTRSEVSGRRLWSLFSKKFGSPVAFFRDHFVANFCPLVFMETSGRNRTPDKLKPNERERLFAACDVNLIRTVEILKPQWLIGIGGFAAKRLAAIAAREDGRVAGLNVRIGKILHPSPASPAANRGWDTAVEAELKEIGVW
jgi:single-strand selective monofunctional uracil DNA glycosylase